MRQNRLPEDLYHHGIQRQRMASFLSALKTRCVVHEVNGGRDFRLGRNEEDMEERKKGGGSWFMNDRAGFEKEVERLTGGKKGKSLIGGHGGAMLILGLQAYRQV